MLLIALKAIPRPHLNKRGLRVLPGDDFEADRFQAKELISDGKARVADGDPGFVPPPPPGVASVIGPMRAKQLAMDELAGLRSEARDLNIEVKRQWGIPRLRKA